MADVAGENNPHMIMIWDVERTKQPWFLRQQRSGQRTLCLNLALESFYSLRARYPESWLELEETGFYPIRPLDPVTGEEIQYGSDPTSADDFINLNIFASADGWQVTGRHPSGSTGTWEEYTRDFYARPEIKDGLAEYGVRYPNESAMRGYVLAYTLSGMVMDYQIRRNQTPTTSEELFDGLWTLSQDWASNDPSLDPWLPGTFVFGYDLDRMYFAAVWRDEYGTVYSLVDAYSSWPEEGWQTVPTHEEYMERAEVVNSRAPARVDEDYIPPNILWTCSLRLP